MGGIGDGISSTLERRRRLGLAMAAVVRVQRCSKGSGEATQKVEVEAEGEREEEGRDSREGGGTRRGSCGSWCWVIRTRFEGEAEVAGDGAVTVELTCRYGLDVVDECLGGLARVVECWRRVCGEWEAIGQRDEEQSGR